MTSTTIRPYRGVFPVAPTIFTDRGEIDLDGQRRCIDFMIDAGSNGICILETAWRLDPLVLRWGH
jgi:2-keto-3-deoxy-L-arabinonate dehydratase